MIKELAGAKKVREISLIHLPNHIRSNNLQHFASIIKANIPKNLLEKGDAMAIPTMVEI